MRELSKDYNVQFGSLPEIRRFLRREAERCQDLGMKGGYAHPRPVLPAHVANWLLCWLSQQTEGDRDRVIREGRRVMDHLAGLDEPPREIPSVPLDVDPPALGDFERAGRPQAEARRKHPGPKKRRTPER